ncbi:MAG: sulfotransferase [Gammaproteobacteria bacterium]|nr:sulfotransferase [Gammaproteobacteria bacterium]
MEPQDPPAELPDLETTLPVLRASLGRGRYAEVLQVADAYLGEHRGHRELLYLIAVAQRMLQRIPEALGTLATLQSFHPRYSRLFQERGHCHVMQRDAVKAIEAFEWAIRYNPALPASWQALERLYRIAGRQRDSANAASHVAKLGSLPSAVIAARGMVADGDFQDAERTIRAHLAEQPDDVEALRVLSMIARHFEYNTDAEVLLDKLLERAPGYNSARYDLVLTLVDLHKHQRAREEAERLMAAEPQNPGVKVTHAGILMALGDVAGSIERYQQLLEKMPRDSELHQSLGHAYKTNGESAQAIESYHRAIEVRPDFGEAYWSLANMKTYRFTDFELQRMRQYEAQPYLQTADRYHLCFALGKALEDRGEYAESFEYYARGNALKKEGSIYRAAAQERAVGRQMEICTPEFFAERRGWGCPDAAPIFVLGLPRAGSTLLEQILASHQQVEGTMELANIPRLVGALGSGEKFGDTHYPGVLPDLTAAQCREFGEAYIRDTRVYRSGKPHFIDKMPNNFRNIALIQLILPNARIIDARRDAMDCCFSNFKQLYANGHPFAYDLDDIGRYYRAYVGLMDHWERVLPGRVLCVRHEDVLADLEGSVRRILDYCGLPFDEACVQFHRTERRVHTASAEQVRRPINRDGVDQWRPYEPWLGPLKEALGPLAR